MMPLVGFHSFTHNNANMMFLKQSPINGKMSMGPSTEVSKKAECSGLAIEEETVDEEVPSINSTSTDLINGNAAFGPCALATHRLQFTYLLSVKGNKANVSTT